MCPFISVKTDTITIYDGEDVYYGKADKNGKYIFQLKPGKGARDVSLTMSHPTRGRLPVFVTDNSDLNIVTNMTDSASYSGVGENEARVFDKNYWFCLKSWRAITVKGRTPNDLYSDFDAMFSTPLRVLAENRNNVSPEFYKQHYRTSCFISNWVINWMFLSGTGEKPMRSFLNRYPIITGILLNNLI